MRSKPYLFLIYGILFLIVPTLIYLFFLVPQLTEEYNVLMASGGIIGGVGLFGASKIPGKVKYGTLFKTATNAFTMLTVVTLVEKFIIKLIGLVATFVVSFIIFKIFYEVYENARERKRNQEFATEVARNLNKNS